ncbi:MAG: dihydrofolate reductase [Polyangiaceae bacterium]
MTRFDIVVAADEAGGIGKEGEIPWHLPGDLAFLKRITVTPREEGKRNAVIMGRKTWETIPPRFQPLPRRLNAVVTRQDDYAAPDGVVVAQSLEGALEAVAARAVDRIFVLGGGEIYRLALEMPQCDTVYLTRVEGKFPADARFPALDEDWRLVEESERHEENGVGYRFQTWRRSTKM